MSYTATKFAESQTSIMDGDLENQFSRIENKDKTDIVKAE